MRQVVVHGGRSHLQGPPVWQHSDLCGKEVITPAGDLSRRN